MIRVKRAFFYIINDTVVILMGLICVGPSSSWTKTDDRTILILRNKFKIVCDHLKKEKEVKILKSNNKINAITFSLF